MGLLPPEILTTAAGAPGSGGAGSSRSGSPKTVTPLGVVAQLSVAPPDVWTWPTTSHSGAVRTPWPLRRTACDEQFESTWTVPPTVTPPVPVILFVPQLVGSRASSE